MTTIILIAIGAVACVWIGYEIAQSKCARRIRELKHLPKESPQYADVCDGVNKLQGFFLRHVFVKNPHTGMVTWNSHLSRSITKEEREWMNRDTYNSATALMSLCYKLGLEIIFRERTEPAREFRVNSGSVSSLID